MPFARSSSGPSPGFVFRFSNTFDVRHRSTFGMCVDVVDVVPRFVAKTHQFDAHVFFGGHVGACTSRPFVHPSASVRRATAMSRPSFHSFANTCLRFARARLSCIATSVARPSPPMSLSFFSSTRPSKSLFFFFSEAIRRGSLCGFDGTRTEVELAEGTFPDLLSQSIFVADAQVHRFRDDVFVARENGRRPRVETRLFRKCPTPSSDEMERDFPTTNPVCLGFDRDFKGKPNEMENAVENAVENGRPFVDR